MCEVIEFPKTKEEMQKIKDKHLKTRKFCSETSYFLYAQNKEDYSEMLFNRKTGLWVDCDSISEDCFFNDKNGAVLQVSKSFLSIGEEFFINIIDTKRKNGGICA